MPLFTIETQHLVPMYRQRVYWAKDLKEAIGKALADDDWKSSTTDDESAREVEVIGAWEGGEAYDGPNLVTHAAQREERNDEEEPKEKPDLV